MTNPAGGGYSRWNELAVTRWREDATCDDWGTFCYLRDVASGVFWSSTHQLMITRMPHARLLPSCSSRPRSSVSARPSTRRPRAPDEPTPWMFPLLATQPPSTGEVSYETDRLQFIGRGRTTTDPQALHGKAGLSGSDGAVLDPVAAIRCRIALDNQIDDGGRILLQAAARVVISDRGGSLAEQLERLRAAPTSIPPLPARRWLHQGLCPWRTGNAGQYTHAAVWAAMAFAALGDSRRAWELLALINPVNHTLDPQAVATYGAEPYVVAADVYAVAPHTGRGGWTWYTGSAGWLYRLIVESLLGLEREGDRLHSDTVYHIAVVQTEAPAGGASASRTRLDGVVQGDRGVALVDDQREHAVEVRIHRARPLPAVSEGRHALSSPQPRTHGDHSRREST